MTETARYRQFDRIRGLSAWIGALAVVLMPLSGHADVAPVAALEGQLSATSNVDGSIVLATVRLPAGTNATSLSASLEDTKDIPFFPLKEQGTYQAVIAVPFNHVPGRVEVQIFLGDKKGLILPFEITDGHYPSEVLKVDEKKVSPPKKEMKRIMSEQAEIKAIYDRITPEKLWTGPFVLPLNSVVTSPYGSKRVYNGQMKRFHEGMDFRAKVGTPILSPAPGIVVLAKDLYFTGNTVLIDHGYGIFTIYGHMSELKVKTGDRIDARAVLGLSGMTGRANGPHLHWGAVVHHLKINPIYLTTVMQ